MWLAQREWWLIDKKEPGKQGNNEWRGMNPRESEEGGNTRQDECTQETDVGDQKGGRRELWTGAAGLLWAIATSTLR